MALECVATILASVKTYNDFLETELFHRLFEASLAASLGSPSVLLREGLRLVQAILEEFAWTGGGRPGVLPRDILTGMGRFLVQAARWADGTTAAEDTEAVRQQILRLLARLPAFAILGSFRPGENHDSYYTEKTLRTLPAAATWESEELSVLQRILSAKFDTESISAAEVRDFLAYLGGGADAAAEYLNVCGSGGEVEELEANYPAVSSASLRAFWASWAVAGYVVFNKLRSPMGKAQETLGAVDQACRRLAALAAGGNTASTVPLEQGRRLVQFVAHLEVGMQNAWDGCATGCLPPAHKSAALFFYANKKTCQDWLERIRGNVMRVAYSVGSYAEVVRHAWSLLPALAKREELDSPANLFLGEF
jgi:hypothetical protein